MVVSESSLSFDLFNILPFENLNAFRMSTASQSKSDIVSLFRLVVFCIFIIMCIRFGLFVVPFCTDVAQSADKHIVAVAELAGFGLVASVLLGANYFVFCSVHGVYVWLVSW